MSGTYDFHAIERYRDHGYSWLNILHELDLDNVSTKQIRTAYSRWTIRRDKLAEALSLVVDEETATGVFGKERKITTGIVTAEEITRGVTVELPDVDLQQVRSLDDLVRVLEVDMKTWRVSNFRGSTWEQGKKTLFSVKANFERDQAPDLDRVQKLVDEMIRDATRHCPDYGPIRTTGMMADNPVCAIINVYDPHLGMLAWGEETGEDYDLSIAVTDYGQAVEHLLSLACLYPIEQLVYIVGHDFLHVDSLGENQSGGVTARGTSQDIDTRLDKMFTEGRRALVEGIDRARRLGAPVRVEVVPGNHDRSQMYRMGEVLSAWYRKCDDVEVVYGPKKRTFYGWGKNAWMFTHGEDYDRVVRGGLPLIFATEAPADLWVGSTYREILTGHQHINKAGRYLPTSEADEERAIRTFALPGLTATDAWHSESGYKHHRAAVLRCYHQSGGVAGTHEYTPR